MLMVGTLGALGLAGILWVRSDLRASGEGVAVDTLRSFNTAQLRFRAEDLDADGEPDYAIDLKELDSTGLVDNEVASGIKGGYSFGLSGGSSDWLATATPISPSMGNRNFIICADGVVRFSVGGPATRSSPAVQ
jgi:hypothetical protein